MEAIIVKEDDISRVQRKYCDLANYQNLSNRDKMRRKGLAKKLQLSDGELNSLNDTLTAAGCRYHRIASDGYIKALESLVSDQKSVDKQIRSLRLEVEHLCSQIIRLEQSRSKLEKIAISDNQYGFNLKQASITVKLLENLLLVAQQKENRFKQDNVKLQKLIRDLCGDRIQFNKLWMKVVDCLCLDKKMLLDMTDQAVLAFEKGTEYRKRTDFISKNASVLRNDQIDEMTAILRSLHMDQINEKFFGNKMHHIQMRQLDDNEVMRRNAFRRYHNETHHANEITLNQVKLKSGQINVDTIVAKFVEQKREYFSLFCYLNNLQLRVMQMTALLARVRARAEEGKTNQVPIKQKNKAKMVLEGSLARAKTENQKAESELVALNEALDRYYYELTKIVDSLNCDRTHASLVKGFENDKVHVHNIGTFLTMVEHRLKRIMGFVFYLEMNKSDRQKRAVQDVDVINYLLNEPEHEPIVHQCAECAMEAEASGHDAQTPLDMVAIREAMMVKALTPEIAYRMHNISQCELPKSRALLAKSMQR